MTRRAATSIDVRAVLEEHVGADVPYVHPAEITDAVREIEARAVAAPGTPVLPVLIGTETREDVIKRLRLSRVAEKAAEAERKRTDREQGRWQSAAQALAEWARYMGDGVDAGSYSRTLAKEIDARRGGVRERTDPVWLDQAAGHRVAIVTRTLERAYPDPFVVIRATGETRIPAALCRTALILRVHGERISATLDRANKGNAPGEKRRNVRGHVWREVPATTGLVNGEEVRGVCERLSAELQRDVTVGDVAAIVRHGLAEMTRLLSAAGLVPEARRRREARDEESMGAPIRTHGNPDRLDGWTAIAAYKAVERDEKTARRWRAQYAMPVHEEPGGHVYALKSELDAWREARDAAQAVKT